MHEPINYEVQIWKNLKEKNVKNLINRGEKSYNNPV